MTDMLDKRLTELGISLPAPGDPAGSYISFVNVGAFHA